MAGRIANTLDRTIYSRLGNVAAKHPVAAKVFKGVATAGAAIAGGIFDYVANFGQVRPDTLPLSVAAAELAYWGLQTRVSSRIDLAELRAGASATEFSASERKEATAYIDLRRAIRSYDSQTELLTEHLKILGLCNTTMGDKGKLTQQIHELNIARKAAEAELEKINLDENTAQYILAESRATTAQTLGKIEKSVAALKPESEILEGQIKDLAGIKGGVIGRLVQDRVKYLERRKQVREGEIRDLESVAVQIDERGLDSSGYEFVRMLGVGGMGVASLYYYVKEDRFVVVKAKLGPQSADAIRRFIREAAIAERLDHPNIARGYGSGVDKGRGYVKKGLERILQEAPLPLQEDAQTSIQSGISDPELRYYATEFVRGYSLREFMDQHNQKKLRPQDMFDVALQMLDAIEYYSGKGLVHRDLKPENIMLRVDSLPSKEGFLKIIDFGIAKNVDPNSKETALTRTGFLFGTPAYMSPAQLYGQHKEIDVYTDLYALGCMMYEMLEGSPLFKSLQRYTYDELDAVFNQTTRVNYPQLANMLMRLLLGKPEERPSIREVRSVLIECKTLSPTAIA